MPVPLLFVLALALVVGGILFFRIHAFLALLGAALCYALTAFAETAVAQNRAAFLATFRIIARKPG